MLRFLIFARIWQMFLQLFKRADTAVDLTKLNFAIALPTVCLFERCSAEATVISQVPFLNKNGQVIDVRAAKLCLPHAVKVSVDKAIARARAEEAAKRSAGARLKKLWRRK